MIEIRNYIKAKVIESGAIPEDRIVFSNAISTDWGGDPYVSIDFDDSTTMTPIISGDENDFENDFKIVAFSTDQEISERLGKQIGNYLLEQVNDDADDDASLLSGLVENESMIETLENESPEQATSLALQSYTQNFKIYHCMR